MSENRNELIERQINREITGALSVRPHGGGMASFTIAPQSMAEVMEFAKLMAVSGICVRQPFRGNPGACLAVTLQAMKWGADPFAVANKAFEVNGQLAYESQLLHAIVNSSTMLQKRLDVVFEGEGPKRQCRVVGYIKGDSGGKEYLSPEVGTIPVKNSPLWKSDPDQQLFYYSTRAWARRWVPEVLLGIYTPEEMTPVVDLTAEDITGKARENIKQLSKLDRFEQQHAVPEGKPNRFYRQKETEAEVTAREMAAEDEEPPEYEPEPRQEGIVETGGHDRWIDNFNTLAPRDDLSGAVDWRTYAEGAAYLISQAGKDDLAALEVSKHPHLKRLREEDIDLYRSLTANLAERAKVLAGKAAA